MVDSKPILSKGEVESIALEEHDRLAGREVLGDTLVVHSPTGAFKVVSCVPPVRVRILHQSEAELLVWSDELTCRSHYKVELVDENSELQEFEHITLTGTVRRLDGTTSGNDFALTV